MKRAISQLALALGAGTLAACSVVTTWDGLGPPSLHDAGADALPSASADGSLEASPDAPISCATGGFYCGGHVLAGDPATLYKCASDGTGSAPLACARGCTRRSAANDTCVCIEGSTYCGNDQIAGDPNTLYLCNGDRPATVVKACPGACLVRPGNDDICQ
jgi:hypothetical protein